MQREQLDNGKQVKGGRVLKHDSEKGLLILKLCAEMNKQELEWFLSVPKHICLLFLLKSFKTTTLNFFFVFYYSVAF